MACSGAWFGCKGNWWQRRWLCMENCSSCCRKFCQRCIFESNNQLYCCYCLLFKFEAKLHKIQFALFTNQQLAFYVALYQLNNAPQHLDRITSIELLIKHFANKGIENNNTPSIETENGNTPIIETENGSTPIIETENGNTPSIETENGNTPSIETENGNTPSIETENGNTPSIETENGNTPIIETENGNTPIIEREPKEGKQHTDQEKCLRAMSVRQLKEVLMKNNIKQSTISTIKEKEMLVTLALEILNKDTWT